MRSRKDPWKSAFRADFHLTSLFLPTERAIFIGKLKFRAVRADTMAHIGIGGFFDRVVTLRPPPGIIPQPSAERTQQHYLRDRTRHSLFLYHTLLPQFYLNPSASCHNFSCQYTMRNILFSDIRGQPGEETGGRFSGREKREKPRRRELPVDFHSGGLLRLAGSPCSPALESTTTSTRRFFCRPSSVLLSAMGRYSPYPMAEILPGGNSWASIR